MTLIGNFHKQTKETILDYLTKKKSSVIRLSRAIRLFMISWSVIPLQRYDKKLFHQYFALFLFLMSPKKFKVAFNEKTKAWSTVLLLLAMLVSEPREVLSVRAVVPVFRKIL